jgi:hypothetical protein
VEQGGAGWSSMKGMRSGVSGYFFLNISRLKSVHNEHPEGLIRQPTLQCAFDSRPPGPSGRSGAITFPADFVLSIIMFTALTVTL